MKNVKLSKELALIGLASVMLVSCGGGGGSSGGVSSGSSSSGSVSSVEPTSLNQFKTYVYDTGWNVPYIVVYIDNQPVRLELDTGASGIMVEQSAVNLPSSDYTNYTFSGQFGDGSTFSGVVASATVCINPSITQSCVVMPIGVQTGGSSTQDWSSASLYGDFGAGNGWNILAYGTNPSGQDIHAYSYQHYLYELNNSFNSYTLSFYPITSSYQAVSFTTPIGELIFGSYTGSLSNVIPMNFKNSTIVFPAYTSSMSSYTAYNVGFDTGTPVDIFDSHALSTEIPNFSTTTDIDNCPYYGSLTSGLSFSYILNSYSNSFTTSLDYYTCESVFYGSSFQNILFKDSIVDANDGGFGYNIMGLSDLLGHTVTYLISQTGQHTGFTYGLIFDK